MLKKRLITVLTFNQGVLFRTKQFVPDYRYTLNFVDAWSVDEIVVLDVTRDLKAGDLNTDRESFYQVVSNFAKKCFVPLAAGGGVRSLDDFKKYLDLGADKVVINSAALDNPELITQAAKLYGSQCVLVSVDVRETSPGTYHVFSECGSKATDLEVSTWVKEAEKRGAGEILITSIERDGSLEGYDNQLNKLVCSSVKLPVLVNSGAGKWQDFVDAFNSAEVAGVCTSCIYHFTETSIKSAKSFLKRAGVDVRV